MFGQLEFFLISTVLPTSQPIMMCAPLGKTYPTISPILKRAVQTKQSSAPQLQYLPLMNNKHIYAGKKCLKKVTLSVQLYKQLFFSLIHISGASPTFSILQCILLLLLLKELSYTSSHSDNNSRDLRQERENDCK